jgi:hypothetical protein
VDRALFSLYPLFLSCSIDPFSNRFSRILTSIDFLSRLMTDPFDSRVFCHLLIFF